MADNYDPFVRDESGNVRGRKGGAADFFNAYDNIAKSLNLPRFEARATEKPVSNKKADEPKVEVSSSFKLPFESEEGYGGTTFQRSFNTPVSEMASASTVKSTPEVDSMMQMLGTMQGTYDKFAKESGEKTRLQGEREQSELKALTDAETGLLPKQQAVLEGQLTMLNDKYTDYLQAEKGSKEELDKVAMKYPVLSRADVISNMSAGEKVFTGLMAVLGSLGNTPPDKNPALAVFNKQVDDAVAKNKQNYDRARQDVLQKHLWDNDDFEVFQRKVTSQNAMTNNIFNNGIALAKAKSMIKGQEERNLDAKISADALRVGQQANMLNTYAVLQNMNTAKRKLEFDQKQDVLGRHRTVQEFGIDEAGNLVASKPKYATWKTGDLAEKGSAANEEDIGALNIINPMLIAIKRGDKNNVSTLIEAAKKYKYQFPKTEHFFASFTSPKDVMESGAAVDEIRRSLVKQINKRTYDGTYSAEEQLMFNKGQ